MFSPCTNSKIHISNPAVITLLDIRIYNGGNLVNISLLNLSNDLMLQDDII